MSEHGQWRRMHDRRWAVMMLLAMAVGIVMPQPLGGIQFFFCGLSLGWRVKRMVNDDYE